MQVEYRYTLHQMKNSLLVHIIAQHESEHTCAVRIYETKTMDEALDLMTQGLEAMPFGPHDQQTKH